MKLAHIATLCIINTLLGGPGKDAILSLRKSYLVKGKKRLQVEFLEQCYGNRVIPAFLTVRIPNHLQNLAGIFRNSQLKALKCTMKRERKCLMRLDLDHDKMVKLAKEVTGLYFPVVDSYACSH
jgi:hypothetical protein